MILKLFDKVLCNVSLHRRRKIKNNFPTKTALGQNICHWNVQLVCEILSEGSAARDWDMRLWPSPRLSVCPLVGCANSGSTERFSITTDIKNPYRNWLRVLDMLPSELRKGRFVWSLRTALCDYPTELSAASNTLKSSYTAFVSDKFLSVTQ